MRILIVTRHFPPVVSGGARRPYLLRQGLLEEGVEVLVCAPKLPPGIEGLALGHPALSAEMRGNAVLPDGRVRESGWRQRVMLPDPDIRWVLSSIRANERLKSFAPDWVVSTSPPESLHIGGLRLARSLGSRWCADFRDFWLVAPLLAERQSPVRRAIEARIARSLIGRADAVSATEPRILREVRQYAACPTAIVGQPAPNLSRRRSPQRDDSEVFYLLHAGSFSLSHAERRIEPALELLARARQENPRIVLTLVGRLTPQEHSLASRQEGIRILPPIGLEQVWSEIADADGLLLVSAPSAPMRPGKLAEYRASGKPIVAIGGGAWRQEEGFNKDPLYDLLEATSGRAQPSQSTAILPKDAAKAMLRLLDVADRQRSR